MVKKNRGMLSNKYSCHTYLTTFPYRYLPLNKPISRLYPSCDILPVHHHLHPEGLRDGSCT